MYWQLEDPYQQLRRLSRLAFTPAFLASAILDIITKVKNDISCTHASLVALGASNLVTGAIALLFVVLAIAALAHLVVWPMLE